MKYKLFFLAMVVISILAISGCIDFKSDTGVQKTTVKEKTIQGEVFIVEVPATDGGKWSTRVYRFVDEGTTASVTCYMTEASVGYHIACVRALPHSPQ